MELIDYLRMLLRRWRWVLSACVFGVALAVVYIVLSPATYTASADLFVGVGAGGGNATSSASAQSASSFTLGRMPSYAALVTSTQVSNGLAQEVGGSDSDSTLRHSLSATVLPRSVVLTLSAKAHNGERAAVVANAAAKRLATAINDIERPTPGAPSTVSTSIVRPASTPGSPSAPKKPLILGLGLLCGLIIGLLAASARDQSFAPRTARGPVGGDAGTGRADPLSDLSGRHGAEQTAAWSHEESVAGGRKEPVAQGEVR